MTKGQGETGTEKKNGARASNTLAYLLQSMKSFCKKKVLQHQLEPQIAKNIFIGDQTKGTDAPSKIAFN